MMGRILVAAASACALVCLVAAPAGAAPALRIEPAPHGKVHAGIAGVPSRGRLVYLLDGHRVRLTRRHAISLSVPRHRGAMAVWHRFEVRRPGSKLVLASTRFAVGARSSRRAPTLVLLDAPPAQTGAT